MRRQACAAEFARHDSDGNGKLSAGELALALDSLPDGVVEQLRQLDMRKCVGGQVLSILESSWSPKRRLQAEDSALYLAVYWLKYAETDVCRCVSLVPVADADITAVATLPDECREGMEGMLQGSINQFGMMGDPLLSEDAPEEKKWKQASVKVFKFVGKAVVKGAIDFAAATISYLTGKFLKWAFTKVWEKLSRYFAKEVTVEVLVPEIVEQVTMDAFKGFEDTVYEATQEFVQTVSIGAVSEVETTVVEASEEFISIVTTKAVKGFEDTVYEATQEFVQTVSIGAVSEVETTVFEASEEFISTITIDAVKGLEDTVYEASEEFVQTVMISAVTEFDTTVLEASEEFISIVTTNAVKELEDTVYAASQEIVEEVKVLEFLDDDNPAKLDKVDIMKKQRDLKNKGKYAEACREYEKDKAKWNKEHGNYHDFDNVVADWSGQGNSFWHKFVKRRRLSETCEVEEEEEAEEEKEEEEEAEAEDEADIPDEEPKPEEPVEPEVPGEEVIAVEEDVVEEVVTDIVVDDVVEVAIIEAAEEGSEIAIATVVEEVAVETALIAADMSAVIASGGILIVGVLIQMAAMEICNAGGFPTCQRCATVSSGNAVADCGSKEWALPHGSCPSLNAAGAPVAALDFCLDGDSVTRAYCCSNPECVFEAPCGGSSICACPMPKGIGCNEDSDCTDGSANTKRYCAQQNKEGWINDGKLCYDGADGDSCDNDAQCQLNFKNYCYEGICYDGSTGDGCDSDADCKLNFNNYCTWDRGKMKSNKQCWSGDYNEACRNDEQCASNICVRGQCQRGCGGDYCESDSDCLANDPNNPAYNRGVSDQP